MRRGKVIKMGHMRSHTIIVSGFCPDDDKYAESFLRTYNKAKKLFGDLVSNIVNSEINNLGSYFIAPDGSKEGWDISNVYDKKRDQFIKYLNIHNIKSSSDFIATRVDFIEVMFADDEDEVKIVRHSDE